VVEHQIPDTENLRLPKTLNQWNEIGRMHALLLVRKSGYDQEPIDAAVPREAAKVSTPPNAERRIER
jgi:hypothetical protein